MVERTLQDFVEDMVSDCRSLGQIIMVAASTQWKNRREEVEQEYCKLKANQKQISNRNREDRI